MSLQLFLKSREGIKCTKGRGEGVPECGCNELKGAVTLCCQPGVGDLEIVFLSRPEGPGRNIGTDEVGDIAGGLIVKGFKVRTKILNWTLESIGNQ